MMRLAGLFVALTVVVAWQPSSFAARGYGEDQSQKPVFTARVEGVTVDVLVTEGARPVTGLPAEAFEVFDNGVRQHARLLAVDRIPLNLVLVLDASESVKGERLAHLQVAGKALLDSLREMDQAGVLTFNRRIRLGTALGTEHARVREAIDAIVPGGSTPLYDATYTALVLAESATGRTLLIVFSDGADTASFLTRDAVTQVARRTDVVTYSVAAGLNRQDRFLRDVARETGGALIQVDSTARLNEAFAGILEEFRRRYLLSYEPQGTAKGGWHQIEVRVKGRRDLHVKARPGYFAE